MADRILLGVALMLGFVVTAPLIDVASKLAARTIPVGEVTAARFLVQGLVMLPLALAPGWILPLVLDDAVAREVVPLLRLFALAYFFIALSPAPFYVANGFGKPWVNTLSFLFNATLNVILIVLFALDGITLRDFVWAFVIANLVNAGLYQAMVELIVWRRPARTRVGAAAGTHT